MTNGKGIDTKLAKLNAQIAEKHAEFKSAVATEVGAVLAGYGLTLDDLLTTTPKAPKAAKAIKVKASKSGKRKAPFKGPQPPKYREPDSGATWSGFGRAPAWIAEAKNRDAFLIQ